MPLLPGSLWVCLPFFPSLSVVGRALQRDSPCRGTVPAEGQCQQRDSPSPAWLLLKDTAALPACNAAASPLQCSAQSSGLGCHPQHFWALHLALHHQDCFPTAPPLPASLLSHHRLSSCNFIKLGVIIFGLAAQSSPKPVCGRGMHCREIQGEHPAPPCALPSLNNFVICHLMPFFPCAAPAGSLAPSKSAALIPLLNVPLD